MLLVIDIGNTNTVVGLYEGEVLRHHFRLSSDARRTGDEYRLLLTELFRGAGVEPRSLRSAILASVVPALTGVFEDLCRKAMGLPTLVVGPGVRTGMPILYENPREVGADRIVDAVAAFERHGGPTIVVDFGTATTFDAVTPRGEYLGGAIAPGVILSMDALFANAAKLPRVELARPSRVIGRNTVASMQSGIFWGYVALVEGMVDRMKAEMGWTTCKVVATGGLAELVAPECRCIHAVDPFLTLDGLRIIHGRNHCP